MKINLGDNITLPFKGNYEIESICKGEKHLVWAFRKYYQDNVEFLERVSVEIKDFKRLGIVLTKGEIDEKINKLNHSTPLKRSKLWRYLTKT